MSASRSRFGASARKLRATLPLGCAPISPLQELHLRLLLLWTTTRPSSRMMRRAAFSEVHPGSPPSSPRSSAIHMRSGPKASLLPSKTDRIRRRSRACRPGAQEAALAHSNGSRAGCRASRTAQRPEIYSSKRRSPPSPLDRSSPTGRRSGLFQRPDGLGEDRVAGFQLGASSLKRFHAIGQARGIYLRNFDPFFRIHESPCSLRT